MRNIQASKKGIKKESPAPSEKKRISKKALSKELAMGMPLRNARKQKKVQRRVMQGNYNEFY